MRENSSKDIYRDIYKDIYSGTSTVYTGLSSKLIKLCITIAFMCIFLLSYCDMSVHAAPTEEQSTENTQNKEKAHEVKLKAEITGEENTALILDNKYKTTLTLAANRVITITSTEDISHIYIEWSKIPAPYQISYNGKTENVGTNGFLHEYIKLQEATKEIKLTITNESMMSNIHAYSAGVLPDEVQVWQPSCQKADILVLSTHADDEALFFGGAITKYAGQEELAVQVVYFSNYFLGNPPKELVREHEKLDGLWTMGVKNYPVNGDFADKYAASYEASEKIYTFDKPLEWLVGIIRKYKPQICITQDINGEYGHGTHELMSKIMMEAVNISNDTTKYPDSASTYGIHDVAKTYIHLWKENKIKLNCRESLSRFDGKTAVEVADAAYKKHDSQQYCWFYVSDSYIYSIAEFGLYRTTVGYDKNNDMMENIVSYREQNKKRLEEESISMEMSRQKAELESIAQASLDASVAESIDASKAEEKEQDDSLSTGMIIKMILFFALIIVAIALLIYNRMLHRRAKRYEAIKLMRQNKNVKKKKKRRY